MFNWLSHRRANAASLPPPPPTSAYSRIDTDNESLDTPTLTETYRRTIGARFRQVFSGIGRDWIAFFTFGIINNLIYVVILSAAVDLVGAKVPKGVVLLADIAPSLLVKMIAPYFVHRIPYSARVVLCASLSFSAVVLIAQAEAIPVRLFGVMMASLSSGLGELTFLMLSSFYRLQMVSAWSSGTGGAGLLGALLFLALTSWLGLSISQTLAVVSLFPALMLIAYFVILTNATSPASRHQAAGYRSLATSSQMFTNNNNDEERLLSTTDHHQRPRASTWDPSAAYLAPQFVKPTSPPSFHSMDGLIDGAGTPRFVQQQDRHGNGSSSTQTEGSTLPASSGQNSPPSIAHTDDNSSASSVPPPIPLAIPSWDLTPPLWDAPLHRAEPTSINTLLAATDPDDPNFVSPFRESEESGSITTSGRRRRVYKSQPNEDMTMQEKRAMARSLLVPFMFPLFLVYFAEYTMNQGVLPVVLFPLDKTPFTHMRDHYVTYSAIYQLGVFISRSSASLIEIPYLWIPSFLQLLTLLLATAQAVLTTGLLGGATYVHTYIGISKDLEHDPRGKEFALGVVGVADGLGILLAGIASLWIEPALCQWQVAERGVNLCLSMAD
ncbi:battenin CLN3 protein [Linnemannia schmuckeri]|uniref:Battenin CLN3 protein n=1 Tax=Linnemannia schmuckeri TaxID=64567 RepID=A0A9P5RJ84_9FUNG|nr:battenin CLN3 protein [Linnemannia schmuckeri]